MRLLSVVVLGLAWGVPLCANAQTGTSASIIGTWTTTDMDWNAWTMNPSRKKKETADTLIVSADSLWTQAWSQKGEVYRSWGGDTLTIHGDTLWFHADTRKAPQTFPSHSDVGYKGTSRPFKFALQGQELLIYLDFDSNAVLLWSYKRVN